MDRVQATGRVKKRKAETQDNERLSKRLSLLNLGPYSPYHNKHIFVAWADYIAERSGQRLYVPVETPTSSATNSTPKLARDKSQDDDTMHLDDTKHKVYIYDLDAELSDSESSSDEGKLVFLPDIQKHLRETRIPPRILANSEGELAGNNLQLVLYNVPSSLTIPEEQDSVRRAIVETRARARARHEQRRPQDTRGIPTENGIDGKFDSWSPHWNQGMVNGNTSTGQEERMDGQPNVGFPSAPQEMPEYDPDAMDLG